MKNIAIAASSFLIFAVSLPVMAQSQIFTSNQQVNQSIQETTISLEATELNQPHFLRVISTGTNQVSGQIKLNGTVIKTITNSRTEINLASSLRRGLNTIEITGNYSPNYGNVTVEFVGTNTQISQQTGGSGDLEHKINIEVY